MDTGGFHGYRKLPNTSSASGLKLSVSDMNNMRAENNNNHTGEDNECTVREQDRFMPIANVIRIMRKILPPHAKISDDAKETIQECVSEYISFITGEANERCQREQRKTITAEDVLWAMSKLGFDDYIEPLTMYLHRYRELEGDRTSMRGEPLGKRTVEYATLGVATAFVPPPFHPNGYFSAAMGSYVRDAHANNAASSHHPGISNAEPNGRSM
ncbi:nuclear transcription factor Y subunit B-6 [Cajanus cajan]|uniref:Nuclear transcription factor Y subunit B-6 n=1 Tax=Cajanus cajan TaxID=3821 RepID=A0A151SBE4_CAJCA|nr:nuclear transcription factor Y subunit B-6 [Cajanus cajan]KYP52134.1 Nuclear transcription factor Y subunit B-6 [Cajanus cajan]